MNTYLKMTSVVFIFKHGLPRLLNENLSWNNSCLKEKFESVLQIFVNHFYSCSYFLLHGFNR